MGSSDGSSRRTASQNSGSPGASTTSPHTVIAKRPPGASHDHARRSTPAMSSTKKIPKTERTASKDGRREPQRLDVADLEASLAESLGAGQRPGRVDQRRRQVDAEHRPARADGAGRRQRRRTGAAAQVEHARARRQRQALHGAPPVLVPERQRCRSDRPPPCRWRPRGPCRSSQATGGVMIRCGPRAARSPTPRTPRPRTAHSTMEARALSCRFTTG